MFNKSCIIAIASIILISFIVSGQNTPPIAIQPMGDIPPSYVSYVYEELHKMIPTLSINPTIPLPSAAYYTIRSRYRADSLIDILSRSTPAGSITIGLTIKDISCTSDPYPDWGVFGLSYCPGKACVASSFRSKTDKAESLFYTAIHELGHAQGLEHCMDKSCIMQDAEGHTIQATEFCPRCKAFLISKGWNL